jgi:hypothetical protein|tara:strand:- start:19680 stop:19823 length:144 start_codon:yes stop_codon:yes gene_type:complete
MSLPESLPVSQLLLVDIPEGGYFRTAKLYLLIIVNSEVEKIGGPIFL